MSLKYGPTFSCINQSFHIVKRFPLRGKVSYKQYGAVIDIFDCLDVLGRYISLLYY